MTHTDEKTVSRVSSRDGTEIGYWTGGQGRPLVLVHGGTADHLRWHPVLPLLEPHCTVVTLDRRGRGASGDSDDYAIEREFEDGAAVVDAVAREAGGPVDLLGHSFGGLCALGAATLTSQLRKLVLYEPPVVSGPEAFPPDLLERLEALMADGRREELLETFFREAVMMPESELETLRSLPAWQARIAAAHTLPRELRAVVDGDGFEPARVATITAPTLMLLGGDSPELVRNETKTVNEALPDVRTVVLKGQQHVAIDTAPELFVRSVIAFLHDDPGGEDA